MGLSEDLFHKTEQISSSEFHPLIKTLISDILKVTNQVKVYVFGSVARAEATTDSDLDILFVLSDVQNFKNIQSQFYKYKTNLGVEVDIVFKTEEQFKNASTMFLDSIKDEAKEVYPHWNL